MADKEEIVIPHVSNVENGIKNPKQDEEKIMVVKINEESTGEGENVRFNPELSDNEENEVELERLRGDAIGNTMFSKSFVLKLLIKFVDGEQQSKLTCEDKEFEKDLCSLWDMTVDKDVVALMMEHNVIDDFCRTIASIEDVRLIEILVGIIGNMCVVQEACEQLTANPNASILLLNLTECTDTPTLIQLMRVFISLAGQINFDVKCWLEYIYEHKNFVKNVSYILKNSTNKMLIRSTITALNAILAKFAVVEIDDCSFEDIFLKEHLVESIMTAYETVVTSNVALPSTDMESSEDTSICKTILIFLNVHCILMEYGEYTSIAYNDHFENLLKTVQELLEPFCDENVLLPINTYAQDIIVSAADILLNYINIKANFHTTCSIYMIRIWNIIVHEAEQNVNIYNDEFEDDAKSENDVIYENLCPTIFKYIAKCVKIADLDRLTSFMKHLSEAELSTLCESFEESKLLEIEKSIDKINEALKATEKYKRNGKEETEAILTESSSTKSTNLNKQ